MDNPFKDFILQQIDYFANEAKRLRDKKPMKEYKALVDTFYFIGGKLGTLEHEVAMARLGSEFQVASGEAKEAWQVIWRDFREQRQRARQAEKAHADHGRKAKEALANFEQSYSEMTDTNPKLKDAMRSAIDAMRKAEDSWADFGPGWRRGPWLMLWTNLQIFSVYIRYFLAKTSFFVFRHSFIFLVSVLILGFAYSHVSVAIGETVAALLPQWPWAAAALAAFGYLVKKYHFDPIVKKLQTTLETKRLRPLAFHLHIVRTMALVSRTARQEARGEP